MRAEVEKSVDRNAGKDAGQDGGWVWRLVGRLVSHTQREDAFWRLAIKARIKRMIVGVTRNQNIIREILENGVDK